VPVNQTITMQEGKGVLANKPYGKPWSFAALK
jgi:hypothetical protein